MRRGYQGLLILSTLLGSGLGMQALHEVGHVLLAVVTGGEVARVVLHPLAFSRTDLSRNPLPLSVVWGGPVVGVLLPLALWGAAAALRWRDAPLLRFFAGFCLVANGAYVGAGMFYPAGDPGEMLWLDSPPWLLGVYGTVAVASGLWLWHGQGRYFGLGPARGEVSARSALVSLAALLACIGVGLLVGRD